MFLFKNNASSSLLTSIDASQLTLVVSSGEGTKFPTPSSGDSFRATLVGSDGSIEIVDVTSVSGDTLTMSRGKEGTTPIPFGSGSVVEARLTEEIMESFVQVGVNMSERSSEYCPGYTYNYVSTSVFSVVGLDVSALFRVGRRIKFIEGASNTYGVVSAINYNTTTAGNTTITMTMESAATLQSGITEFCLTTGSVAWSPIVAPPMAGSQMNGITAGYIGLVKYWIIVGDAGKIAYSTSGGASWTDVTTTGTTENITSVAYDHDNQRFMAVSWEGGVLTSSDGTTWTYNSILKTAMSGGSGPTIDIQYSNIETSTFSLYAQFSNSNKYKFYTSDFGATWEKAAGLSVVYAYATDSNNASDYAVVGRSNDVYYLTSSTSTSASSSPNNVGVDISAIHFRWDGANRRIYMGLTDGDVVTGEIDSDTVVKTQGYFTSKINDFSHSIDHERTVVVGDNATLGYLDDVDIAAPNTWVAVTTGFNPTSDIMAVHYDEDDNVFVAVNSVGQVARSSSGTV